MTSPLTLPPTALAGSRVYCDPAIWQQAVAKLRDTPWAGFRRRSKQDRRAAYPLFVQRPVAQFATINETVCILNGIAE